MPICLFVVQQKREDDHFSVFHLLLLFLCFSRSLNKGTLAVSATLSRAIPHKWVGAEANEFFVRCNGRFWRFTGGKSKNLQAADGGKGIAYAANELCGIALIRRKRRLHVRWAIDEQERCAAQFDLWPSRTEAVRATDAAHGHSAGRQIWCAFYDLLGDNSIHLAFIFNLYLSQ